MTAVMMHNSCRGIEFCFQAAAKVVDWRCGWLQFRWQTVL